MIMNKTEILKFLEDNPMWVLQRCLGIGDYSWWWLRCTDNPSMVKNVNGNSGKAASRHLKMVQSDFKTTAWAIKKDA